MSGSPLRVLNRGPWTPQEDMLLKKYIEANGVGRWSTLPQKAGLMRAGKSCRLRWMNHLRPNVKRGHISPDEEDLIIRLHKLLGNRWSLIAGRMPGRTDNEVKNYWNTHLSKKLGSTGTVRRRARGGVVMGQPLSCADRHKSRAQTDHHKHKLRSKIQTTMNTVAPDNHNSFALCPLSPTDSMAIPLHVKQEASKALSHTQLLDVTMKCGVTEPPSTDSALLKDDSKIGSGGESGGSPAPSLIHMNISYATTEDMADFLPLIGVEQNNSKDFCSDSFASCWTWFDNLLSGNDFI